MFSKRGPPSRSNANQVPALEDPSGLQRGCKTQRSAMNSDIKSKPRATALGRRTGWMLFSFFLVGAGIAMYVDLTVAPDDFWPALGLLFSGGGMVWLFCFGRWQKQRKQETPKP